MRRGSSGEPPATEAWRLIFGYFFARLGSGNDAVLATAESFGLRPGDMKALLSLAQPRPMRDLAESMVCDPSTITGLVDRLEGAGLVERRPSPEDRRIKLLALTPAGVATRKKVMDKLHTPPDAFLELSLADQRALRDLLRKAFGDLGTFW